MIATELEIHGGRITRLAFRQADGRGRGLVWPQQLRVVIDQPDGPRTIAVDFSGPRATVAEVIGWPAPRYVLPTGGGWAYGGFVLDPMSRGYLSRAIGSIADPLTRGAAWVTLWETMLDGDLAGSTFVDSAMAAVSAEPDEQTRARLLGYVAGAWWRHLSDTRAGGTRRRSGEDAASRAGRRGHRQPEGGVVRGAAPDGDHAGDAGVAQCGVGEDRDRRRAAARRDRLLRRWRSISRCAR